MDSFADMVGRAITRIETVKTDEGCVYEVHFAFADGATAMLYHEQDCCESVTLHDIAGSLDDLIGVPILKAEESSNSDDPPPDEGYDGGTHTWTFYHLVTVKGYATLRWYGESNGYYSESVEFRQTAGE